MWRETLQPAPAAPAAPAAPVAAAAAAPAAAALPKAGEDGNWYVPGDFDTVSFLKQAKEQFVRIQAVWDSGETDRLREFLTDDLIVELKPQLAERGGAANKTEVVLLNAELLGIETVSDGHLASVRSRACCARPRRRGLPLRGSLEPVQAGQRRLVAGRHPADPGRLRQLSLTSAAPIRTALAVRSQPALLGRFFHVRAQSHATPRPVTLQACPL